MNIKLLQNYTEDDVKILKVRADYFGMAALTEEEQYVLEFWKFYLGEKDED